MNDAAISIQPQPTWSDEDRARAEHYALIARLFHAAPDAVLLGALAQAGRTLGGEAGDLPRAWAAGRASPRPRTTSPRSPRSCAIWC